MSSGSQTSDVLIRSSLAAGNEQISESLVLSPEIVLLLLLPYLRTLLSIQAEFLCLFNLLRNTNISLS